MRRRILSTTVAASILGLLVSSVSAQVVFKQYNTADYPLPKLPGVRANGNLNFNSNSPLGDANAPLKSYKYIRTNTILGLRSGFVTNLSEKAHTFKNPPNLLIKDPSNDVDLTPTSSNYSVTAYAGNHKANAEFMGVYVPRLR